MKIEINPNQNIVNEVRSALKNNDGYCPCKLDKNQDTKCMCKDFREQNHIGLCHCELYNKTEV